MLPSRNHDRVLTLQIHYFETAELMYKNYDKLNQKIQNNGYFSQHEKFDIRIYFSKNVKYCAKVDQGIGELWCKSAPP
ncbi:Signal transduction histidine kinase [Yersinia aldovae]|uniref:Signal transduction histidine kinase n=1 Tax=Yersinia aldovae TaxID=29483 RepID=A0A0T9T8R9_YERAL|nr:Signal transduction histidine kinase [Yersinia aldovae]CNK68391.1 Signal transduction histidine kinase [Yersinia aldovae]CNL83154.1 Signal transduction histidine kinase [Yersinia aldovae]